MIKVDDEKLLELGRAVHEQLQKPVGDWPRVLVFELLDHRRRLDVSLLADRIKWSDPMQEDVKASTVKFPGTYSLG